jgi:hypothetical protein
MSYSLYAVLAGDDQLADAEGSKNALIRLQTKVRRN